MFCISCGKKISKISKFCKYCGAKQIIKKKLNKKEYETIWACDYCGKEFKTKDESDEHELTCKKNQTKQNLFWIFIVFLGIYFLTYFISNSYAQNNDLPTRDLLQPQKWFSSKVDIIPTPTIIKFPVEKLELQNVKYDGKVLTGSILNKGDKPTFNTKLSLKISKDHSVWSIEEQHDFIVQYKIDPNQSVKFSENFKTTKINPWTATAIVESKYYNGENIPTPSPTFTPKPKTQNTTNTGNNGSQIDCIGPDGKQFKTTMIDCKALNEKWGKPVDYMTNCTYSDLCVGGGGVRYVKKSECDKPCERASISQQGNTGQKTSGNSFYCWNNAYGYAYYTSSGDQCNLDNLKSTGNKICLDTQKIKSDTCGSLCKSDLEIGNSRCKTNYTTSEQYGQCLNGPGGTGEVYGSCLSKCTDEYAQDLKTCN